MENHMLLLAVFEDGEKDLMPESKDYIKALGGTEIDNIKYRHGYIFAGVVGKTSGKDQMSTSDKTYIK
jgi:cupin superfamily acireductone dioxygenase involved in methionine salvage